ncbi:MAG: MarR family winged helix-turn-helix transcriptional regulator [Fidelibacterota bacterium]
MEFGELVFTLLRDLQAVFRRKLKLSGITLPQLVILSSVPDEGIDMTSLAQNIGVDNSTLTRTTGMLIGRGLIYKEKSEIDHRSNLLFLTAEGERVQEKIDLEIDRLGEEIGNLFPYDERDEIKSVLASFHWAFSRLRLKQY